MQKKTSTSASPKIHQATPVQFGSLTPFQKAYRSLSHAFSFNTMGISLYYYLGAQWWCSDFLGLRFQSAEMRKFLENKTLPQSLSRKDRTWYYVLRTAEILVAIVSSILMPFAWALRAITGVAMALWHTLSGMAGFFAQLMPGRKSQFTVKNALNASPQEYVTKILKAKREIGGDLDENITEAIVMEIQPYGFRKNGAVGEDNAIEIYDVRTRNTVLSDHEFKSPKSNRFLIEHPFAFVVLACLQYIEDGTSFEIEENELATIRDRYLYLIPSENAKQTVESCIYAVAQDIYNQQIRPQPSARKRF